MRHLTIKRQKAFAASLMKVKVYVNDPNICDLTINGLPCRKLGELKNGEEKTFVIGNEQTKIFVIGDTLSKGFCNEFCTIPAGEEDVFLSGRNHANPANGNAFLFDGVDDPEVLKNRKKGKKTGLIILIIAAIVGFAIGFVFAFGNVEKPQEYKIDDISITLTNKFFEIEDDNFEAVYGMGDYTVMVEKIDFNFVAGGKDLSCEEIGKLSILGNGYDSETKVEKDGGLVFYKYTATVDKTEYTYFVYLYKGDDAFWSIQFALPSDKAEENRAKISEWAKSVKI